ncbi:helix-turn-helix domain-containing protein [Anabaena azotica]|uniref:Helix-turn-helix transcriptional regulator n=1 Tax=Anabaena azotica FACHB-119 TaxID=947527 RepID=A0ABR8CYW2_9NOST|nr:helix-turn-helix transcriptional regulator [Anabaena azotica]MBD2499846.1 helix-turn-helix transcriptional regulator [Anabaena azotica FACHB-119]
MTSQLTLGWLIRNGRKSIGLSQSELCKELSKHGIQIDYHQLSKIENDRIDVRNRSYDKLILAISNIFTLDPTYLEEICQQTEIQPLDLSQGIFPIYIKDLK